MNLSEIEALCVIAFTGPARSHRQRLFYALEEVVQGLLRTNIRCDLFIDGSFLTEKPEPSDVDILAATEISAFEALNEVQRQTLEALNTDNDGLVDSLSITTYPRDHPHRGFGVDGEGMIEGYGIEHAQVYLKGYAVLRLGETDVGNRICR